MPHSIEHGSSNHNRHVGPTNPFHLFGREEIEQSIPDRFEKQVVNHPHRIAVKTRRHPLTYAALNGAANRVAWAIMEQSRSAEVPVALLFKTGAPFVIASLAALKAGRIQVPLESGFPRERLRYMLTQSRAATLVTNTAHLALASELGALAVINIDELDGAWPTTNPSLRLAPESTAVIGYTSGSTGQPKGIVWNHRGMLHAVMRHTNAYRMCVDDRMVMFRTSVRAYLYALLNGAAFYPVALRDEDPVGLADWMAREEVTVYRAAVSAFRSFAGSLHGGEQFPRLRMIEVFGEAVYPPDIDLYRRHFADQCILATSLGCQEFDDYACFFMDKSTPVTSGVVPGGYLMADAEILLLDDGGRPVDVDHVGEIVIRSRYNAVGYWDRPDLTAGAFRPDPAGGAACLYHTGDLGRMQADGCLFHAGRQDFQVKIRGHRVEVTEVETALLELDGVKEAVVVGREESPGDKRLVAYIVPADRQPRVISDLRRLLAEKLPDYMVPSSYVVMETLPLTATGKVDRCALPAPGVTRPALDTRFVGPRNPLEQTVAAIWAEVLGLDRVGVHDPFLELGGDSLLATQVISRILVGLRVVLPMRTLFDASTVAEMAAEIVRHQVQGIETQEVADLLTELEATPE